MNKIIEELIDNNHEVIMCKYRDDDGEEYHAYAIEGFYKHGRIYLVDDQSGDGSFYTYGRYGQMHHDVTEYRDILLINYDVWLSYKDRGYSVDIMWIDELLDAGILKRKERTVVEYE